MVINGEKAPAFSATTLTLPPAQTDNTGRIIEHTRANFSRSREDIEQEISNAINPPQPQQQQRPPQSASQARQWPINAQSNVITPAAPGPAAEQGSSTPSVPLPTAEGDPNQPPKKKRTRKRKKKTPTSEGQPSTATEATPPSPSERPPQPSANNDVELRLR
jgi:hypothetical protein